MGKTPHLAERLANASATAGKMPQRASRTANAILLRVSAIRLALASPSPHRTEKEQPLNAMWKPSQTGSTMPNQTPEPPHAAPPAHVPESPARVQAASSDQATIGKGLFIKGEITGSESLYIDGKVEGAINLPGNRVTIGRNGQVGANITAREVVVLGKVRGNVSASDRVDIRAEGSLNGDVAAARISIEDGAFFKGGIDIRKADAKASASSGPVVVTNSGASVAHETAKVAQA
jgi:cytoskeletal protein CcmA (bactofilin family)